jgi:CSLREA domain-containing protein
VRATALAALLIAAGLGGATSPAAQASTIAVTSTSGGSGGPGCTLRDAITAANLNAPVGGCPGGVGADVIELAPEASYIFSVADNTIGGANALPVITTDITINGHRALIARNSVAGIPEFRLFNVGSGGTLRLNGVALSGGKISGDGGGIAVAAGATLRVTNSTFLSNRASGSGGAIGGGGTIVVAGSAFAGNSAGALGGAIAGNSETVSNSTFTVNSAAGGGAVHIEGTLAVLNSTIAGNSGGGGISGTSVGSTTLTNTLVANNAGGNCVGAIADGGGNLRWPSVDSSCAGAYGDPRLGPFQNNGGPTPTMAPGAGSAAIDAGLNNGCLPTDQRGVARPQDGDGDGVAVCDIGAYEVGFFRSFLPRIGK